MNFLSLKLFFQAFLTCFGHSGIWRGKKRKKKQEKSFFFLFFCHFFNRNRFQMSQLSKYRQSLDKYFSGLQFGTNPEFLAQFIEKLLQFKCISWWKKVTQQPFSLSFPPSQFRNAQNRPKRPEKKALSSKNSLEKILSCAPNLEFWAPFPPP